MMNSGEPITGKDRLRRHLGRVDIVAYTVMGGGLNWVRCTRDAAAIPL